MHEVSPLLLSLSDSNLACCCTDTKVKKERLTETMMEAINGSAATLDAKSELKERLHAKILETQGRE